MNDDLVTVHIPIEFLYSIYQFLRCFGYDLTIDNDFSSLSFLNKDFNKDFKSFDDFTVITAINYCNRGNNNN